MQLRLEFGLDGHYGKTVLPSVPPIPIRFGSNKVPRIDDAIGVVWTPQVTGGHPNFGLLRGWDEFSRALPNAV